MADLKKELANRLGLTYSDELTDEQLLAATDEALAERAEPTDTATAGAENTVTVDRTVFDQLQAQATQGATAFANLEAKRREDIVNAALRDGKITASSKQDWLDGLEKNEEGTTKLLNSLAAGTVLNTQERGTTGTSDATSDGDPIWNTFYGNTDSKED